MFAKDFIYKTKKANRPLSIAWLGIRKKALANQSILVDGHWSMAICYVLVFVLSYTMLWEALKQMK